VKASVELSQKGATIDKEKLADEVSSMSTENSTLKKQLKYMKNEADEKQKELDKAKEDR